MDRYHSIGILGLNRAAFSGIFRGFGGQVITVVRAESAIGEIRSVLLGARLAGSAGVGLFSFRGPVGCRRIKETE